MNKEKKSLLVFGAGGMLGQSFHRFKPRLARRFSPIHFSDHSSLDLTDKKLVLRTLEKLQPDLIINCAAIANVEQCEKFPKKAFVVNAEFPGLLATWANRHRAKLVHYSTDAVFDGRKPPRGGYRENDAPNPLNAYAKSKLDGERLVRRADPNALILRVNIVGIRGKTLYPLAEWILRTLASGKQVTGFTDVIFSPLSTDKVVELTLLALKKNLSGIYHLNATDAMSKYEFAKRIAKKFGYDDFLVVKKRRREIMKTPGPTRMFLDNSKFVKATKAKLTTVDSGIEDVYRLTKRCFFDFRKHRLNPYAF